MRTILSGERSDYWFGKGKMMAIN